MTADAALFMAYEYGTAIGLPASEVVKLPIAEYTTGYMAYLSIKRQMLDDGGNNLTG